MLSNFIMQVQTSSVAYLRALFEPVDCVAVLAVCRSAAKGPTVLQRIVEAGRAIGARYQAWLRHLNSRRAFGLTVNPHADRGSQPLTIIDFLAATQGWSPASSRSSRGLG